MPAEAYWTGRAEPGTPLNLTAIDVSFDSLLPTEVTAGDALDNIDWHPDFTMRRCTMRGNRAPASLISTRGRVFIGENSFCSPGSAIQISGGIGLCSYHTALPS